MLLHLAIHHLVALIALRLGTVTDEGALARVSRSWVATSALRILSSCNSSHMLDIVRIGDHGRILGQIEDHIGDVWSMDTTCWLRSLRQFGQVAKLVRLEHERVHRVCRRWLVTPRLSITSLCKELIQI